MKYIITERQSKILNELRVQSGKYEVYSQGELFKSFYSDPSISYEEVVNATKEYLSNSVGIESSKLTDDQITKFVRSLPVRPFGGQRKNKVYSIDVISGLSYFLAKKYKEMNSSHGLEYFIEKFDTFITYWFFDPENEDFVGRITVELNDTYTNSANVVVAEIDEPLIGRGYGSKMYFTLVDIYTYLMSDRLLFKSSLNIWVNVLPRYCNVWAKIVGKYEYFKITKEKLMNPKFVDYYVASKQKTIE